jgi:hypothetical protein
MNEEELDWDDVSGRGDPCQRYRIYRLCPGQEEPELVATCPDESSVGTTLCTLGREGEFLPENGDCAIGILDLEGEVGKKWLVKPWLASPKNVADAGRLLRQARDRD